MRNWRTAAALTASASLFLVGCGGSGDNAAGGSESGALSGTILIDGSSTVAPLSETIAELFQQENSGVRVTVGTSGTGGGFQKFCNGETDMNDASRAIKESEIAACDAAGIAYDSITVANDAISLIVNPENPLQCVTLEQATQIWNAGSTVNTWGDITGLELPEDWKSKPINLFGPGTDSGTFDFFTEAVNGEEGVIRENYTDIGEDDNAAVTGISGDPNAMGFIPYSFTQEVGDRVKPLEIDSGTGCVAGNLDNVQSGTYAPLGRELFVYASDKALRRPEVLEFMKFYIDNSDTAAEAATYIPLTDEQKTEAHTKIDELAANK
ncbi:phosphate ABC transporter substrate-binding protein PstS family protein [[Mycobacterium] burgundiense]|uniref:Phosphate-binding protein n=1 Tax=[Mycobacterium] burgundiense TaxID=3064286 RepID=A0ABM9LBX6_9MYCO|nr:phosphate ABC transporter substrate-binding protein PstS family protein [Mycolicibacterium sp. MU0053]CAJ1496374.1 phosphate ABC transporter substrate-binding protein PstS family protein [Mycolicibacterium sp. MU0053]